MNSKSQTPRWYSSNLRWYVLLATVPVVLAVGAALFAGYREWRAAQAIRAQYAHWA
ncbi:MAG: hypothetical protein O3C60_17985 [Planctomycetota bacterium]|nr:hypothetical protein [Planctomycetota bacterium]